MPARECVWYSQERIYIVSTHSLTFMFDCGCTCHTVTFLQQLAGGSATTDIVAEGSGVPAAARASCMGAHARVCTVTMCASSARVVVISDCERPGMQRASVHVHGGHLCVAFGMRQSKSKLQPTIIRTLLQPAVMWSCLHDQCSRQRY
jgi:hypothetical protein